jgi:hypothetical protein
MVPRPTTNEVEQAIADWLPFCEKLGINAGACTNVGGIDWARSWAAPCLRLSRTNNLPTYNIRFTNGVVFQSVGGVVFWHVCLGENYNIPSYPPAGPAAPREGLRGKIAMDWKVLAAGLKPLLVKQLGIPEQDLAPFTPDAGAGAPEQGTESLRRLRVTWTAPGKRSYIPWPAGEPRFGETKTGFDAEFDLDTGRLEGTRQTGSQPKPLRIRRPGRICDASRDGLLRQM